MTHSFDFGDAEEILATLRRGAATDLRHLASFIESGCETSPGAEPVAESTPSGAPQPEATPHPSPAPRAKPSAELLAALAPHVAHELVAMEHSRARWKAEHSWIALEATLLHTRVVSGFLWGDPATSDGVIASDYQSLGHSDEERPDIIGRYATSIDRQLSQVTAQRVTGADPIPVGELVDAIWAGWRHFLAGLADDRFGGLFRWYLAERADQWQVRLPDGAT